MRKNWRQLLICLAIPLGVGALSGWLTQGSMAEFARLTKPPLSPPGWLFPVVWTILYTLMGIASYLVYTSGKPGRAKTALTVYGVQLFFNFLWSIVFFNLGWYLFAFLWIIALWLLVIFTTVLFYRINRVAGYLMIPYILWVTFAAYLNLGIYLFN